MLSFAVMVLLIFVGENLALCGWVSTSPHIYLDLPFGWLRLHRYGERWIVEQFDLRMLVIAALSCILLTWVFEKALRHRLT